MQRKKKFGWWLKKKEKNSFFRWSRKHFLLKENLNFGSNQYLIIDNSEMFCLLDFFFYAKPDIHVQKLLRILWLRHRWFRKDDLTMSIQLLILRKIEYQPKYLQRPTTRLVRQGTTCPSAQNKPLLQNDKAMLTSSAYTRVSLIFRNWVFSNTLFGNNRRGEYYN